MKLLSTYNRVNVLVTIVVLLLSAFFYYFFIEAALIHQLDKNLVVEENEITGFIHENDQLPEPVFSEDEQEIYTPGTGNIKRKISTVEIHNKEHDENIFYRQLEFPVTVKGKIYRVDVRKSKEETEDLVQLILKITFAIVVLLLITLFIINRFVLSKLWKPFNTTLQQIKQFNLSEKDEVYLEQTNINEFTELNTAVKIMTKKASSDYDEIKSFTENASHEIQTPLAIIKSRLELLSQSESLGEEDMNTIQIISETTNRLSKLNQSLLLLTKIDNKQFKETEQVNISDMMFHVLDNYEELLHAKQIIVIKTIEQGIKLVVNETLAEILITNLLTNAIKHNIEKGVIEIGLNKKHLLVSNTGAVLNAEPSVFFERFKKGCSSNDSLGLGLSIVKKICVSYGFTVTYNYSKPLHKININF
jgi:signal transduction histidine kinase